MTYKKMKKKPKKTNGTVHEFYNVAADTEYQGDIRLVATPIESRTKMLSLIIVIQLMIKVVPLPFVGLYTGLSARKTSKPDIDIQQFVKRADLRSLTWAVAGFTFPAFAH